MLEPSPFRATLTPYWSTTDPCPVMKKKVIVLPPQLFMSVQPPGLPQFTPSEALRHGSLWPALVDGFSREEGIS